MSGKVFKRFMVFESYPYEASGGIYDCSKSFDTKNESIEYAKRIKNKDAHVFDRTEGKLIFDKE